MKKLRFLLFVGIIFLISQTAQVENNLWPTSNGNFQSHKYSNLKKINEKNTSKLEVAWVYNNGFKAELKPFRTTSQLTPIFTGTSVITSSLDGYLISINPVNGVENWRTKLRRPVGRRGLVVKDKKIFVPTSQGVVVVNELTGKIDEDFGEKGFVGYYGEDFLAIVPPIIDNQSLIVAHQKKVESYKLPNGKTNWSLHLNGSRVWSPISFDKKNETIAIVTSNLINLIGNTEINPDYSNSLLLINSTTGKVRCKFKDTIHDHWDLDMTGSPIITEISIENKIKSVVYAFSKTGNIFIVDIEKCKLINKETVKIIKTETISDIPNQIYSNFQKEFTSPKNIVKLEYNLEKYVSYLKKNNKNYEYIKFATRNSLYGKKYIPLSIEKDVIMHGIHGGFEWPGGTLDKINNQIIIPSNHYPWIIRSYYYEKNKNKLSYIKKFVESFKTKSDGEILYQKNCQSCHGVNREGVYESELYGNQYIPSLVGISFKKKINSLNSLESLNYNHKYIEKKIDISEKDLLNLNNYFLKLDSNTKKNSNLGVAAIWQLLLNEDGMFASEPPWGKITAFDLKTNNINWSIPFGYKKIKDNKILGEINFGGLTSTSGNIFFATGTPDKYIRAYRSSDGKELWSYKMQYAGSAPPMTYSYENEQYLIVNASGGRYYGFENITGDAIYAFKIKKSKN